jgi:hypothetical protein
VTAGEVFRRIIDALEKSHISYMLTGSFASSYHGSPLATQDIDLVIEADESRVRAFSRSLPRGEYYVDEDAAVDALKSESQFNVIDLATGWKIDLIIRKSRPFSREEFDRRIAAEFEGTRLSIASAEDVILAKLEWSKSGASSRQIDDVAALMRVRGSDLDMTYLQRWVHVLGVDAEWSAARSRATRAS